MIMDRTAKFFGRDRFAALAGIRLVEVAPGRAVAEMEVSDHHFNAVDVVHGGAIFTLADFAFAAASNSHGQVALAINASISYFHPARGRKLTAEATEVSANNRLASYNVDVFDDEQKLVARFSGMVYRKKEKIGL